MRATIVLFLFLCACGDAQQTVQPLSTTPGELTAITYNMYYGLAADLLPEDLRLGSLSATMQSIIRATSLTDWRCRIQGTANQIAAEQPDVIGLQEALIIAYVRDLDDVSEQTVLVDFITELLDDIERAGGPRYQAFQRDNAILQDSLPLVGGIRLGDRGGILVHPRLPARQAGSLTYQTLQPAADIGGTGGVVVRGALHVQVPITTGGALDFFSTHLQSGGDPAVRLAQAQELSAWIQSTSAPGGTIVLTGDLNDVPTSATVMTFNATLVDTYGVVGAPPGFTAYQQQSLDSPTNDATLRIDFIYANVDATQIEDSRVIFNAKVAPCGLWPSDHFGVVSRFRTGASLPPGQRSE